MKILLNKIEEEFDKDTITVDEMILLKKFSFKMRIIKINGVLISKDKYDTIIHNGDNVDMIYLMSGG